MARETRQKTTPKQDWPSARGLAYSDALQPPSRPARPAGDHGEAKTEDEKQQRLKSDFLCYCNHDGLFADFHSFRHLFITRLEQAGISPKMAQTLARHSDVRLTLGVYTHVDKQDQTAAIEALPGPPEFKKKGKATDAERHEAA